MGLVTCDEGYKGGGAYTCQADGKIVGEECWLSCDSNPCLNGGECEDLLNGFVCHCGPNFFGKHCGETHDDCTGDHSELCGHGTCVNEERVEEGDPHYSCTCDTGYSKPDGEEECSIENTC